MSPETAGALGCPRSLSIANTVLHAFPGLPAKSLGVSTVLVVVKNPLLSVRLLVRVGCEFRALRSTLDAPADFLRVSRVLSVAASMLPRTCGSAIPSID